jgi:hypothetical protein
VADRHTHACGPARGARSVRAVTRRRFGARWLLVSFVLANFTSYLFYTPFDDW